MYFFLVRFLPLLHMRIRNKVECSEAMENLKVLRDRDTVTQSPMERPGITWLARNRSWLQGININQIMFVELHLAH